MAEQLFLMVAAVSELRRAHTRLFQKARSRPAPLTRAPRRRRPAIAPGVYTNMVTVDVAVLPEGPAR